MEISKEQVKKILKTLPISYYIGRKVKVILSEDDLSHIDLMTETIYISYPQMRKANIPNIDDIENYIRALLYHELSHAMLTPMMFPFIDKDILNIFEDERIETICNNFYLATDFKDSLRVFSPYRIPTTDKERFFNLVRHRDNDGPINQFIDYVIHTFKDLKRATNEKIKDYQRHIKLIYDSISEDSELSNKALALIQKELAANKIGISDRPSDINAKELFDNVMAALSNSNFYKKALEILSSRIIENGRNAKSHPSYSGKLMPRRILRPDNDYKWWAKQGDGFLKHGKKLCLNLYIDKSGSFKKNERKVNSMLNELARLEKKIPNFTFNLVLIGQDITIPKVREIACSGGNSLTSEIKFVRKKIEDKENKNISIVLFDGNPITDDVVDPITNEMLPKYSQEQARNIIHFSTPNTIIIASEDGAQYFEEYAYSAKKIITNNYYEELEKNVLKCLKILVSYN